VGLLNNALLVKQIEFLREVTPTAGSVAFLVNPHNPNVENDAMEAESAARTLGVKLLRLSVSSEPDLDAAFAMLPSTR
jgi:ABC-type uncharacterized transport system substrate-binding protein